MYALKLATPGSMLNDAPGGRINALDSLRGLAALSVVLSHALATYSSYDRIAQSGQLGWLMIHSPLVAPVEGHDAVMLFFVLSGFVLALPFLSDRPPDYRSFALRRICRIYLPYIATLFVALFARSIVSVHHLPGMADEISTYWTVNQELPVIAGYFAMTGFRHHMNIDPVVWSLVHELRISLIFPGLFWLVTSLPRLWRLPLFLAFSVACSITGSGSSDLAVLAASILESGSYVWLFVLGIELARHRAALTSFLHRRRGSAYLILPLALGLYCIHDEVPALAPYRAADLITGVGAAGFVWLVIGIPRIQRVLSFSFIALIGRCSYSLYLVHLIVMLAMLYGLSGLISPWMILAAFPFAAIAVALVMWRYIEVPSQELGWRLVKQRKTAPFGAVS